MAALCARKDFILHEHTLNEQTRALQLEPQKITAAAEQHVLQSWIDVLLFTMENTHMSNHKWKNCEFILNN